MSRSKISESELDRSNDAWRSTPLYRQAMDYLGVDTSKPIKLSERQRDMLALYFVEHGGVIPRGLEFDSSANLNRDDRGFAESGLGKALIAGSAIGASLLIPGVGPAVLNAVGIGGGSGATAAGATGAGATAAGAAGKMTTADIARDVIRSLGAGAGEASQALAANRGTRMEAALAAEGANQGRRRDDRDSRQEAWRASQHAAHVANPDRGKAPGFAGQYSRNLNLPPLDPTIVAARADEAKKRLTTPYQDFDYGDDMNPSGTERALDIGSTVAGIGAAVPDSVWKKLGRLIF